MWVSELEFLRAADRWRAHNRRARAEGCKCGRPAIYVRNIFGTVGGVPHEVWTCAEHVNVGQWQKTGDGPWRPIAYYTDAVRAISSEPIKRDEA